VRIEAANLTFRSIVNSKDSRGHCRGDEKQSSELEQHKQRFEGRGDSETGERCLSTELFQERG
jgi:hypothetical protein